MSTYLFKLAFNPARNDIPVLLDVVFFQPLPIAQDVCLQILVFWHTFCWRGLYFDQKEGKGKQKKVDEIGVEGIQETKKRGDATAKALNRYSLNQRATIEVNAFLLNNSAKHSAKQNTT